MRAFLRHVFILFAAAASVATSSTGWGLRSQLPDERITLAPDESVTRTFVVTTSHEVNVGVMIDEVTSANDAIIEVTSHEAHGHCTDDRSFGLTGHYDRADVGGTCPLQDPGPEHRYDFDVRIWNMQGTGPVTFTLHLQASIGGTDDETPPGAHVEIMPSHEP